MKWFSSHVLRKGYNVTQARIQELTTQIVTAYIGGINGDKVRGSNILPLITNVYGALSGRKKPEATAASSVSAIAATTSTWPAVLATKSVFPTYIICLECAKRMTMLKRHLMTAHSLSTDQYRAKYRLPGTYPMVAPDYAEVRSTLAKASGLGKHRTLTKTGRAQNSR